MPQYSALVLRRNAKGTAIWLRCLTETAEFYGWTDTFEPLTLKVQSESNGYAFGRDPGRVGSANTGGKRLFICRNRSTQGFPKGETNAFRVHSHCSNRDLAELAHFTKGKWEWMEGLFGQRRTKAHWLEMYEAA